MLVAVEFVFVLFSQHAGVLWAFHAVGQPPGKSMPPPPPFCKHTHAMSCGEMLSS